MKLLARKGPNHVSVFNQAVFSERAVIMAVVIKVNKKGRFSKYGFEANDLDDAHTWCQMLNSSSALPDGKDVGRWVVLAEVYGEVSLEHPTEALEAIGATVELVPAYAGTRIDSTGSAIA